MANIWQTFLGYILTVKYLDLRVKYQSKSVPVGVTENRIEFAYNAVLLYLSPTISPRIAHYEYSSATVS